MKNGFIGIIWEIFPISLVIFVNNNNRIVLILLIFSILYDPNLESWCS